MERTAPTTVESENIGQTYAKFPFPVLDQHCGTSIGKAELANGYRTSERSLARAAKIDDVSNGRVAQQEKPVNINKLVTQSCGRL